ncbi:MAG: YchF/TatD family DNA exonuclease [Candidatus Omnitrophica bacterium]|nr:YchF/TatD family DNA exonuclease [Candidatus Omnitrophota bacterium]
MLIDTHCHLDFPDFERDRRETIERAERAGVKYLINVASNIPSNAKTLELSRSFPSIFSALGVHPHEAKDVDQETLALIKAMAQNNKKVVAIGEIGLDFYRNISESDKQIEIFKEFLLLAASLKLPLIIHCRDARKEILEILKKNLGLITSGGVFHCFSGDKDFLKEVLRLNFYVSFTANITYPKADDLREIVKIAPIEKILLETDCPFLSPQAKRGSRNEPSNIVAVAENIAQLKELSLDDVSRITGLNACQLFKLPHDNKNSEIAYSIRDSLYLNITNRCTNSCSFCVRFFTDYVKGHNLRLKNEPSAAEIIARLGDVSKSREVVFCGYGEPLLRLDVVKEVAKFLKEKSIRVRINTNGHGNLIHERNIVPELKGLIDEVSVSLNVDTEVNYNKFCRPQFDPGTFGKIKEFILECKKYIPLVSVTFMDLAGIDLKECERTAKNELGVNFRIRKLHQVG